MSPSHTPVLDLYFCFLFFVTVVAGYFTNKGYAKIERAAVLKVRNQSRRKRNETIFSSLIFMLYMAFSHLAVNAAWAGVGRCHLRAGKAASRYVLIVA
jgi:hypothetical protein